MLNDSRENNKKLIMTPEHKNKVLTLANKAIPLILEEEAMAIQWYLVKEIPLDQIKKWIIEKGSF